MSRSHDIIRGGYGKKIEKVLDNMSCMMFTNQVSHKKNHSVEKDSVRFGVKATIELGFDFKTFCIGNREYILIHV